MTSHSIMYIYIYISLNHYTFNRWNDHRHHNFIIGFSSVWVNKETAKSFRFWPNQRFTRCLQTPKPVSTHMDFPKAAVDFWSLATVLFTWITIVDRIRTQFRIISMYIRKWTTNAHANNFWPLFYTFWLNFEHNFVFCNSFGISLSSMTNLNVP